MTHDAQTVLTNSKVKQQTRARHTLFSAQYLPAALTAVMAALFGTFFAGVGNIKYYPFCAACFAGVWISEIEAPIPIRVVQKKYGALVAAFFGAAVGALAVRGLPGLFTLLLTALICALLTLWQGDSVCARDKYLAVCLAWLAATVIFYFNSATEIIAALSACGVSVCVTVAVSRGLIATNSFLKRPVYDGTRTALAVLCALIIVAVNPIRPIAVCLAVALAITTAYAAGFAGLRFALLCAFGAAIDGFSLNFTAPALITVTAFIICAARPTKKIIFVVITVLIGLLTADVAEMCAFMAGAVIFMFIPRHVERKICEFLTDVQNDGPNILIKTVLSLSENEQGTHAHYAALALAMDKARAGDDKTYHQVKLHNIDVAHVTRGLQTMSGDAGNVRFNDKRALILLSDGMGTGHGARNKSDRAITSIVELFSSGVPLYDALSISNAVLIDGGESYATIDALEIDRQNLRAVMYKLGAPQSYVERNKECVPLYGEALPLGILEEAQPYRFELNLRVGDVIVMATDGVTDALGKHMLAAVCDAAQTYETSSDIASAILNYATALDISDDMSVTAVKIS